MMGDREFERYEQIFADCQDRLVSYSELLRLPPVKRGVLGDLREYVMAFVKFSLVYVKGRMHGGAA